MALTTPQKSFDVTGGGSSAFFFRAHPRYDAVRVEFDSGNTTDTNTDVTVKIDSNDEVSDVQSNGFGSMDATVYTDTGIDASSSDVNTGTDAVGRTVGVQIEPDTADAAGTIYLHPADDPAQNASAFANR